MKSLFWRVYYMFKKPTSKSALVEAHCRKYGIKFKRLEMHNVIPVDFSAFRGQTRTKGNN